MKSVGEEVVVACWKLRNCPCITLGAVRAAVTRTADVRTDK